MLSNLVAEMARQGLTRKDIAEELGLSYGTVIVKIKGDYQFDVSEAKKIKEKFFPNLSIEYLFENKEG